MRKHLTLLVVALVGCASLACAQGRKGLRLNEVMVVNVDNFVDDYGERQAWIELFNSTYAPLEISSVYLTNDSTRPTLYPVPLGDVKTHIPKRQHVVFWADGKPTRGTFHTNFVLSADRPNWIGLYDADGLTLIDSITVPVIPANTSFARKVDGKGLTAADWEVRDGSTPASYVTPSSNNIIRDTNHKVETFKEVDENGFGLTIMAMCIVFSALLLLSLCFYAISKIGQSISERNKLSSHGIDPDSVKISERPDADSGEVIAAIGLALYQHLNAHDTESTVLTINKVKRAYSPWSSKIYNMRELPKR